MKAFVRSVGYMGWSSVIGLLGCYTEPPPQPSTEVTEQPAPLFGALTTKRCTTEQQSAIRSGHELGKLVSASPAFRACVSSRLTKDYKPCGSPKDSFFEQKLPTEQVSAKQISQAKRVMGFINTAPMEVTCVPPSELPANAGGQSIDPSGYNDTFEQLKFNRDLLNLKIPLGLADLERGEIADTLWHEAMHQQGYRHPPTSGGSCGYDPTQYDMTKNSVPYIAGNCMAIASLQGRAYGSTSTGAAQSFPYGTHRYSQGDFNAVGNDQINRIVLGPATWAFYCVDDPSNGPPINCTYAGNPNVTLRSLDIAPNTSAMFVGPLPYVTRKPSLIWDNLDLDEIQAFKNLGEFRNDLRTLTIGNDVIQSIYVSPGTRVRACEHEGTTGHGEGLCVNYDEPTAELGTMANRISYLEIEPVLSAYSQGDGFGKTQNFGPGTWLASDGAFAVVGDNAIAGFIMPEGLTATLCSDHNVIGAGTGTCRVYEKSALKMTDSIPGGVSYVRVERDGAIFPNDHFSLTVQRSGTAGTVFSVPYGVRCGTSCSSTSAMFYRRSQVTLRANVDATIAVAWSGCDSVSGKLCTVQMGSNRTVSVSLSTSATCFQDCYSVCRFQQRRDPVWCNNHCNAQCN